MPSASTPRTLSDPWGRPSAKSDRKSVASAGSLSSLLGQLEQLERRRGSARGSLVAEMTRPSSMSPKLGHGETNAMASTRGCSGLRGSRTSQSSCAESRSLASGLPSRSASHASHVSSLASDRSSCGALQSGRSLSARGAQSARGSQSAQGSQTARGSGGSERDAWLSMSSGQSTSACRHGRRPDFGMRFWMGWTPPTWVFPLWPSFQARAIQNSHVLRCT